MKTLLKNGQVINVFTGECEKANVLIDGRIIAGVGQYEDQDANLVLDITGKYICPGFIDGHIHIESTMLTPTEFARTAIVHGTTAVVADPHEITNVSGADGIRYMLAASEGIPLSVYCALPSCVPATEFDEPGAALDAEDMKDFLYHSRIIALGEVMNYPGVIHRDEDLMRKITYANNAGLPINGHAPLLSGKDLDRYISSGIYDDHECSSFDEAKERIRKGQWVMIRQGTAARNLQELLPLFEEPWASRCLLVTDDKHPKDLLENGHIDDIIRQAVELGKDPITAIRMATIQAAQRFGLQRIGAIAPGYDADFMILDDLQSVSVRDVYRHGQLVVQNGCATHFPAPPVDEHLLKAVSDSFQIAKLHPTDFILPFSGTHNCHVIGRLERQLLTDDRILPVDFDLQNGVDLDRDILKIAVCERHHNTGHKGIGYIQGIGLKYGAIASSVSHDSHNLIIIGTNEADMAYAGNRIRSLGGGCVVVKDGAVIAEMPLPIGGLMTDLPAASASAQNEAVRESVYALGVPASYEPFMTMAFISLPVIPHIKMTTHGLVDVDRQSLISMLTDN